MQYLVSGTQRSPKFSLYLVWIFHPGNTVNISKEGFYPFIIITSRWRLCWISCCGCKNLRIKRNKFDLKFHVVAVYMIHNYHACLSTHSEFPLLQLFCSPNIHMRTGLSIAQFSSHQFVSLLNNKYSIIVIMLLSRL